jgi:hypothetical protein
VAAFLALLSSWLLPVGDAASCKCVAGEPFLQVAPESLLVLVGRVLAHRDDTMEVAVQQVLQGRAPPQVRIAGDNGKLCRPPVASFPVGTSWVFAVSAESEARAPAPDAQEGGVGSDATSPPRVYALSLCGHYWLRVEGQVARGAIRAPLGPSGQAESMALTRLRSELLARSEPLVIRRAAQLKGLHRRRVILTGLAENAKAGAVLIVDGVPVYMDDLDTWPDDQRGRSLRMAGSLQRRKRLPAPETSRGEQVASAPLEQLVLVDAQAAP